MNENIKIFPGFRTIKTAIAVFFSLLLYAIINREGTVFAVLAVLVCMQDSVEKSIKEGINRTIGTMIGAFSGTLFVFLDFSYLPSFFYYGIVMLGIVFLIHICHLIGIRRSIVIASVVYMVIILGAGENPIQYSIDRTIDTLIGIIMAVSVNRFMFKPKLQLIKPIKIIMNNGNRCEEINFEKYTMQETRDRITLSIDKIITQSNEETAITSEIEENQLTILEDIEGNFKNETQNDIQ